MKNYSHIPNMGYIQGLITEYARLKNEQGAKGVSEILSQVEKDMTNALEKLKKLPVDPVLKANEPDKYKDILKLRPKWENNLPKITIEKYREKLKGAFLSRMAGCTLGAIVEAWSVEQMEEWAKYLGVKEYPMTDYWPKIKCENEIRYLKSKSVDYTKPNLDHIPCDDDTNYTLLGLLIAEEKGIDFTYKDTADVWKKYITMAYSAEYCGWQNILNGIDIEEVGSYENPYVEWLGADIRCDPFGYIAAGNPELAAKMAYNDAYITHRRNGIYGAMFFAATIAAAFVLDDAKEALKIGLTQIPENCALATDVKWALDNYEKVTDYKMAHKMVAERFEGASIVHTNLNACLSIFGCAIGGKDTAKGFSHTVAMSYDNDCTAATTGSILGAANGISSLDEHWYKPFNNKFRCYFNGPEWYEIDDILNRFEKLHLEALKK